MKKFSKKDLLDYIKNHFKEGTYYDYMKDVTEYVYTIRIPAVVTKIEVITEDGEILEEEQYPEPQKDKLTLNLLKFGFKSNKKLQDKEVVDKFMKTFEDVEKKGYAIGFEELLDEDAILIRRTYVKEFMPLDITKSSRCCVLVHKKKRWEK